MINKNRGNRLIEGFKILLYVIGILSIGYYIVILSFLGFRKDFSLIWPMIAVMSLVVNLMIKRVQCSTFAHKAIVGNLLLCAFAFGILVFSVVEFKIICCANHTPKSNADYMIVLGAQVRKTTITRVLKARLDSAYEYLAENENTKVIVSGGKGPDEDISEAEAMRAYLVEKGIAEERIIMEDKSTDTAQNIEFSKKLMEENKSVVIVTSGFHLYRGLGIAKKQGIEQVEGLGASTVPFLVVNYYVRECFGVIKDSVIGNM